ncbi:hypothetical protein ACFS07_24035 [Undibacterium arcticum]
MPPLFVAVIARLRQLRILLLLLGLGLAQTVTAMEVLRILAWPGYADPDVVVEFERRHNIRVEVSYIDSDDGLWNRIHNNSGKNFDVFAVNTAELQRYIDQGLTVPINLDHVKKIMRGNCRASRTTRPSRAWSATARSMPFRTHIRTWG